MTNDLIKAERSRIRREIKIASAARHRDKKQFSEKNASKDSFDRARVMTVESLHTEKIY